MSFVDFWVGGPQSVFSSIPKISYATPYYYPKYDIIATTTKSRRIPLKGFTADMVLERFHSTHVKSQSEKQKWKGQQYKFSMKVNREKQMQCGRWEESTALLNGFTAHMSSHHCNGNALGEQNKTKVSQKNACFGKAIGQHLCRYSDILKLTRQGTFRLQKLRLCWPNTKPGAEFSFRPVWNLHNRRSLGGEIGKVFYCQIICCPPLLYGIIHKYSTCLEFF